MAADLGGGAGGSPEELLSQIQQLLQAYLAMGPDTPVAAQAQALSDAIDATVGGNNTMDPNAPDPMAAGGGDPLQAMGLGGKGTDNTQLQQGETGYSGGSMNEATKGAADFLKKRKAKAGP
jgi:hypothetical protein